MKAFPATLAPFALSALLLAGCGRQESVDELPSANDLANASRAEIAKAKVEQTPIENRNYVNDAHGFSILLPEGWRREPGASTALGVVSRDPGAGADVRAFWSPNTGDKDLREVVQTMNEGAEAIDGDFVGEHEYRGTANDGEGNNVAVRLLRKTDGSLVTATFVYPELLSEQYMQIAEQTLDTLRVFDTAAPPVPAAPGNETKPAGKAAE
jgi:outer membrane murein-binding lipoprotein Lpp